MGWCLYQANKPFSIKADGMMFIHVYTCLYHLRMTLFMTTMALMHWIRVWAHPQWAEMGWFFRGRPCGNRARVPTSTTWTFWIAPRVAPGRGWIQWMITPERWQQMMQKRSTAGLDSGGESCSLQGSRVRVSSIPAGWSHRIVEGSGTPSRRSFIWVNLITTSMFSRTLVYHGLF